MKEQHRSDDVAWLVRDASARLRDAGVESARVDAQILLAHAAGVDREAIVRAAVMGRTLADLLRSSGAAGNTDETTELTIEEFFGELIARRSAREPLQHLTGRAAFRFLEVLVGPGVFVPRPETEIVAQQAIDEASRIVAGTGDAVVVDLCTGSGAIALAVASEVPGARVHAVELDASAFEWTQRNAALVLAAAEAAGTPRPQVHLTRGDARRALPELDGLCDVVVSNPPYVPPGAVPRDEEVAGYDPHVALYGLGADGLEVPRGIIAAAARLLRPGGLFVMEHAEVQDGAARDAVAATGAFTQIHTRTDLTDRPRMVLARLAQQHATHSVEAVNVGDSKT